MVKNGRVYLWNTLGSIASATQNFAFLLVITRTAGKELAGDYSVSYAIANLMWTIGIFEATNYFVTDADNRFT